MFDFIEIFYNRQRLHSTNEYISPTEFEDKMLHLEMISEIKNFLSHNFLNIKVYIVFIVYYTY
ncbi:hypothetical protein [Aliarcobacter skirrowii]|uniref:hypothetical protein n=1 Tax=Aliarcobacter skirrowii TaxID=28200 RepID=UPI003872EAE2